MLPLRRLWYLGFSSLLIISVHAQQVTPPPTPIFSDPQTRIQWKRHIGAVGNENIRGNTWEEARGIPDTANQFSMFGYADWRLPTLEELETLQTKEPSRSISGENIFLHPQIYGSFKSLWSSQYHPDNKNPCYMTFASTPKVECTTEGPAGILLVRDTRQNISNETKSVATRNSKNPNIFDATLYGRIDHSYPVEAWMEVNDKGKFGRGMHLGEFSVSVTGLPCGKTFTYRTALYWNGQTIPDPNKQTLITGSCIKVRK